MTTTPVMTLTDELLAEIEGECALAAALDCNAAITPEHLEALLAYIAELRTLRAQNESITALYRMHMETEERQMIELRAQNAELARDAGRLDWLADPDNEIGNVQLPTQCVLDNPHSMRDAIDAAMKEKSK